MAAGQRSCVELIWRRGSKGLQRGRFLAPRVRPAGVTPRRLARRAGGELAVRWLLVEWPHGKAEPTKYWLAILPESTPLVALVGLARLRWRVEQDYRELKGALGLDHFEGRGWRGWHHHVTLVSVAHGFLTLERLQHPNQRRRPDPVAAARAAAGSARMLGPAPVRCASVPHRDGYAERDDHSSRPDRVVQTGRTVGA
jgi:SRSO17 transposase